MFTARKLLWSVVLATAILAGVSTQAASKSPLDSEPWIEAKLPAFNNSGLTIFFNADLIEIDEKGYRRVKLAVKTKTPMIYEGKAYNAYSINGLVSCKQGQLTIVLMNYYTSESLENPTTVYEFDPARVKTISLGLDPRNNETITYVCSIPEYLIPKVANQRLRT